MARSIPVNVDDNYLCLSPNPEWVTERRQKAILSQQLCRFNDVKLVDSFCVTMASFMGRLVFTRCGVCH